MAAPLPLALDARMEATRPPGRGDRRSPAGPRRWSIQQARGDREEGDVASDARNKTGDEHAQVANPRARTSQLRDAAGEKPRPPVGLGEHSEGANHELRGPVVTEPLHNASRRTANRSRLTPIMTCLLTGHISMDQFTPSNRQMSFWERKLSLCQRQKAQDAGKLFDLSKVTIYLTDQPDNTRPVRIEDGKLLEGRPRPGRSFLA